MPSAPHLNKCDIVMKGGITSGIVYPGAVSKLAERYRFDSIGGTSAGAIAAALAAAAECARAHGRDVFAELAEVPRWLGAPSKFASGSNLFNLFQPQKGMRGLFRLGSAFLVPDWPRRMFLWARTLWLELVLGIIPAVGLSLIAWRNPGSHVLVIILALASVAAGVLLAVLCGVLARIRRLPAQWFGLCTGYEPPREGRPPSLTSWLNDKINSFAGVPRGKPLTFGDLREAGIRFRAITTCLTYGRPYTLPFETNDFYFDPEELRRFFPPEVVQWMEDHPCEVSGRGEPVDAGHLKPLPAADHLPVIVAVRMSLSFPVLFCSVPLYAVDWSRRRLLRGEPAPARNAPGGPLLPDEMRKPEPVWFSDGGICSNFPLHLFDAPLPRWPTFGFNLREERPDRKDRIWMPRSNGGGIANLWMRLGAGRSAANAARFGFSIIDAARNWMDNLQTMVPGYRDRVVHIYLSKTEGGLNLNMPEETIETLSGYGAGAAEKLVERFLEGTDGGQPTRMTWDNHRWVRCRSTVALLEDFIADLRDALEHPEPGDRTYRELIERQPGEPPASYQFENADQRRHALWLATGLEDLAGKPRSRDLAAGAPRPEPALRIRPRF